MSRQHEDFPIGVPSTGHVAIYTVPPFAILTRFRERRKSSVWSVFRDRCHRELMTPVYTGGASSYGAARLVWHCHQTSSPKYSPGSSTSQTGSCCRRQTAYQLTSRSGLNGTAIGRLARSISSSNRSL